MDAFPGRARRGASLDAIVPNAEHLGRGAESVYRERGARSPGRIRPFFRGGQDAERL